jgi:HPt (histidine-containing phosphotransfer) domain-containing protein
MTANALEDDRQRALDAGINAHLSKPIDVDELVATLARLTGRTGAPVSAAASVAAPCTSVPNLPGIDLNAALPRFGGSLDAFAAVLGRFVAGAGASFDQLHAHVDAAERADALALAHRLRGVAANLGAVDLAAHALALEAALRAGDDAQAARQLAQLEAALAPLQAAAHALAPPVPPPSAQQADPYALAQLLELLQNNNMKAMAAHAALANGLEALLGSAQARALAEAIGTLRFEHAAALLAGILERKGDA